MQHRRCARASSVFIFLLQARAVERGTPALGTPHSPLGHSAELGFRCLPKDEIQSFSGVVLCNLPSQWLHSFLGTREFFLIMYCSIECYLFSCSPAAYWLNCKSVLLLQQVSDPSTPFILQLYGRIQIRVTVASRFPTSEQSAHSRLPSREVVRGISGLQGRKQNCTFPYWQSGMSGIGSSTQAVTLCLKIKKQFSNNQKL